MTRGLEMSTTKTQEAVLDVAVEDVNIFTGSDHEGQD